MSTRPPIWYFSDAAYPGGAEQYLRWLLESLGPERAGLIVVDREGLRPWAREVEAADFCVERLQPGGLRDVSTRLFRRLRKLRPAVLHINLPGPYDALLGTAPLTTRLAGVPRVVVTEHLPGVGRVGKRYYAKRLAVGCVDVAIALCDMHRRLLVQTFGYDEDRVRAIPNGVPEPAGEVTTNKPADLIRIVQLGSLEERKGGETLLRALAKVAEHPWELIFVGEGPARARWEDIASELGISDRVQFVGHQSAPQAWLRSADVVALASVREGMPLSLLEAMAVGRPIVASDVDGIPELIQAGETGALVTVEDVDAWAAALRELLENPQRRAAWARAARRRYLERYQLRRMVAETEAVYDGVA